MKLALVINPRRGTARTIEIYAYQEISRIAHRSKGGNMSGKIEKLLKELGCIKRTEILASITTCQSSRNAIDRANFVLGMKYREWLDT